MGYLAGFLVTLKQHRLFGGDRVTTSYSGGRISKKGKSTDGRDEKIAKPDRMHGRHVLNRYEDGMEKCIGCELCAGVCPANCIYVRGADNDAVSPTSPGERYGFVYEINYLRCIHCDLCVEACPTEAITESKLFEFSFTNRSDGIYTKSELLVDDSGKPKQMPWEDWREGEDLNTSGWMRATSPNGDADFIGEVGWSNELGHGLRAPEPKQHVADASRTVRTVGRGPAPSERGSQAGLGSSEPGSHAGPPSSEPASHAGPTSSEPGSSTADDLASETKA